MKGITYTTIDCDASDIKQIIDAIDTINKIEDVINECGNEDAPVCFYETVTMLRAIISGDFRC